MPLPPFQLLLDSHGPNVHRFLIASVGPVDADDCYQETWLAALRAYPQLRDASNLRSWILTIAHRKAIDHVRARARRATPLAEVGEFAERGGKANGRTQAPPDESPCLIDRGLWTQVAALPDKQRTAVALRFITDAAYAEIGTVMQTSEEAARRNVHEGLKRLRKDHRP